MSELKNYLELPYTVFLRRDNEGDFVAKIDELPGCAAHGKTREEALASLDEAKALWIEDCLENGDIVPQPAQEETLPSGKWLQRVPRKLHRKLQILAQREGVSFNQCVTAILAEAVGERTAALVGQQATTLTVTDPYAVAANHYAAVYEGYFLDSNFELIPNDFRLVETSAVGNRASTVLQSWLAHLSSQLPDKMELKSKVTKDEDKRHTSFKTC